MKVRVDRDSCISPGNCVAVDDKALRIGLTQGVSRKPGKLMLLVKV